MRRGISLGLAGIVLAVYFSMLSAGEKPAQENQIINNSTAPQRTTVQYFSKDKVTTADTSSLTLSEADQRVEQTGYKLAEKPENPPRDYYLELFGNTSDATKIEVHRNEKPMAASPKFIDHSKPVPSGDIALPASKSSSIAVYDEMLKDNRGKVQHSSQKSTRPNYGNVSSAGFQQSDSQSSNQVRPVAQFGELPPFPPLSNQDLAADEDLDIDEQPGVKLPQAQLGQPVPAPPNFPGATRAQPPKFDWSEPPTKQPFPNSFPASEPPVFSPVSSSDGAVNKSANLPADDFLPFPNDSTAELPAQVNKNQVNQNQNVPAIEIAPELPAKLERAKPSVDQQTSQPQQAQSVISSLAPAGPSSPMVTLQWKKRDEINVGQPAVCDLVVENTGLVTAENVIVEAQFPESVRLQDANPPPEDAQSGLIWMLGTLNAGSSKSIQVTLIPMKNGDFAATAHVRFTGTASGVFAVRQPMIKVVIEGPNQVMIGDPAPHIVTVTNPGTGVAKNVIVQTQLPAGLDHPKGKQLMMQIGSINPGESRTIRLALSAIAGGTQPIIVQVQGDAGLNDKASLALNVMSPSLAISIDGPALRYKGRAAIYSLAIKNTGTIASNNIKLMHKVPTGMEFVATDRGANYDPTTRIVNWFVGRLNVGETTTLMVKLNSTELGEFKHHLRVTSEQGTTNDAVFITKVEGLASLSVDVADIDDPVEVGEETAYEIKIINEGSKEATNLIIACEMPEGVQFLSAEGPTEHISDLEKVAFRPISTLAPGKTISCRVIVRGQKAGDARLRVKVTSDSISDPIQVEELTRYYGDGRK